jgi:legumain
MWPLLLFAIHVSAETVDFWAFLVAGSRGIANYRHQADVCHTYILFTCGHINESRIVVMMYDDVAWSSLNPLIGRLYNEPDGENVYETCAVDYKDLGVNPETFSNVLIGDNGKYRFPFWGKYLRGIWNSVTGPKINSNSDSIVFLSFVDHGEPGQLLLPTAGLTGPMLLNTVNSMSFKRLIIYVEACFAGSVFENIYLPEHVIAVTASNATESSWGTFCPTPKHPDADTVNGVHIGSCLGDLFEVSWKRDLESRLAAGTLQTSTFREHIESVRTLVANKSHVMVYGDTKLLDLNLSEIFPLTPATSNRRKKIVSEDFIIQSAQLVQPVIHRPSDNAADYTLLAA